VNETFFIDIWSDVVCPFCYLGTRQLAMAMERFEHSAFTVVRYRAFELDPHAALAGDDGLDESLAQKYSMSVERARSLNRHLEDQASTLGMAWRLDLARPANTFDAHRLMAYASTKSLAVEMNQRLFRAYFSEGQLLSDRETLSSLAQEVGLGETDALWSSDAYADRVRNDERWAQELDITGVPAMLLDGSSILVGAQGADRMLVVLNRAWTRRDQV
jgi:predicted DsbA family dithiol-disulfide isomerase